MNVIIVSDFHIRYHENKEDKLRKDTVVDFLKSLVGNTDILIMNGDIFDLWFAWKNVIISGYFSVLKTLSDLQESGCRLIFIAGNHDFWFGDFLKKDMKMEVYPEYFTESIDNLRYFVAHGDRFTENDRRYQIFRSFIRNKIVMKVFEMIHPDISLRLGMLMSRSSRNVKIPQQIAQRKEQGLVDSAKRKSGFFDVIVFGHSHRPAEVKFEKGTYVNTGDWIKHNTYVQIKNGKIKLQKYQKKELEK